MKRKDFIKHSALAGLSFTLLSSNRSDSKSCTPTPDETAGPFPTHDPATLVAENIISDRSGLPLTITIAVNNINDKCAGLKDAIIDIWHCDSKGEYSEYGGANEQGNGGGPGMRPPGGPRPNRDSFPGKNNRNMPPPPMGGMGGMQAADHKKEHFLRGRQITNAKGLVSFHSIYPGWYPGRAPHIHVQIRDKAGNSLLVTQIAFPEEISKKVFEQGVYAAHGQPDTLNTSDNVFSDSIANELGTLTGNTKDGFIVTHAIYVKA
jgi:protocatechuate 3,4-dioxygenase beta subunit